LVELNEAALRSFNIEYEMSDDDVAHLCHDLNITVQAARALLVNQNRDVVRAQIEQLGAHLTLSSILIFSIG
jgi:hypothetical protein